MSDRAMLTAVTGMKAQTTNIEVISNNLANVGTYGFKKSLAAFQDLEYESLLEPGQSTSSNSKNPVGQQVGTGTRLASITKDFHQGSLVQTDRDLDVAIEGAGFLEFKLPSGDLAYSRDGRLQLDNDGTVVNSDGFTLQNAGSIPPGSRNINISPTGMLTYYDTSGNQQDVGQLQVSMFVNPAGLSSIGGNLYQKTASSGEPSYSIPGLNGAGSMRNKHLEASNVMIVEEMVKMISAQRSYEVNSKAIRASDEMLSTANQIAR